MQGLKKLATTEPVMLVTFIGAIINLVVLFGVPITEEQKGGILFVVDLGLGLYARSLVTPNEKVATIKVEYQ